MNRRYPPTFLAALLLVACHGRALGGADEGNLIAARTAVPDGTKVFNLYCASCHGEHGVAPGVVPVMGPGALRSSFGTGLDLLRYLEATMPPGPSAQDLSPADYVAVTEYLLRVQGVAVPEPFDARSAAGVQLRAR